VLNRHCDNKLNVKAWLCVQDDSEGDDFEPADGDLDDDDEDEEAAESEEGISSVLPVDLVACF